MSGNRLRHLIAAFCLATTLMLAHGAAWAETAKVTFILMNDIYQMGETAMPDGKSRGGFARLAAVVKAERAKGGHVILAHGGDTLSPSLMSGIDQGAHIMVLTNMLKPDIFAPGNHEFDFGKATFLKRMAEANFPLFAANMRLADGQPLPGFKDRAIVTIDGVRIGLTGAAHENTPRMSSSEDLKFAPSGTAMREQAAALRREGADFIVAVMHVDRHRGQDVIESHAVDLVLTGHNHDLFIQFDGRAAMVESGYDAHYVTMIDVTIEVKQQDGKREVAWWPQFRVVDTATVTPDPEVAATVTRLEQELSREMDVPLGTTSVELDSRNATVRGREAAIGNLIADAMRARGRSDVGLMNGGGIRAGRVYPPGTPVTRRDVLAELPFGNHMVTIEVRGEDLRAAIENGLSRLPGLAGRFPHVSGMRVEYDTQRPPGSRVLSIEVGGAPLSPTRIYRVTTNDFMARGGDDYTSLTHIKPVVPLDDTPRLSNEVMVYLREQGGVRTSVDGRMRAR
jgi:5'-nucleotidase/UDP-sugar diphosphatase